MFVRILKLRFRGKKIKLDFFLKKAEAVKRFLNLIFPQNI